MNMEIGKTVNTIRRPLEQAKRIRFVEKGLDANFRGRRVEEHLSEFLTGSAVGIGARVASENLFKLFVGGPVLTTGVGALSGVAREAWRQRDFVAQYKEKIELNRGVIPPTDLTDLSTQVSVTRADYEAAMKTGAPDLDAKRKLYKDKLHEERRKRKEVYSTVVIPDGVKELFLKGVNWEKLGTAAVLGGFGGLVGGQITEMVVQNLNRIGMAAVGGFGSKEIAKGVGLGKKGQLAAFTTGAVAGGMYGSEPITDNLDIAGAVAGGAAGREIAKRNGAGFKGKLLGTVTGALAGGTAGYGLSQEIWGHSGLLPVAKDNIKSAFDKAVDIGKDKTGDIPEMGKDKGGDLWEFTDVPYHKDRIADNAVAGALILGAKSRYIDHHKGFKGYKSNAISATRGAVFGGLYGLGQGILLDHVSPDNRFARLSELTEIPHKIGELGVPQQVPVVPIPEGIFVIGGNKIDAKGFSISKPTEDVRDYVQKQKEEWNLEDPLTRAKNAIWGETLPAPDIGTITEHGRVDERTTAQMLDNSVTPPNPNNIANFDRLQALAAHNISDDYRIGNSSVAIRAVYSNNLGDFTRIDPYDATANPVTPFREVQLIDLANSHKAFELNGVFYLDAKGELFTTARPDDPAVQNALFRAGLGINDIQFDDIDYGKDNIQRFSPNNQLRWYHEHFSELRNLDIKATDFKNTHIVLVSADQVHIQNINYFAGGEPFGPIIGLTLDATNDGHQYISFSELQERLAAIEDPNARDAILKGLYKDGWYQDGDKFFAAEGNRVKLPEGIKLQKVIPTPAAPSGSPYAIPNGVTAENASARMLDLNGTQENITEINRMNTIIPSSLTRQTGETFWSAADRVFQIDTGWTDPTTALTQKEIFIDSIRRLAEAKGINISNPTIHFDWLSDQEKLILDRLSQTKTVDEYNQMVLPELSQVIEQIQRKAMKAA